MLKFSFAIHALRFILLSAAFLFFSIARATCLNVDGAKFEAIGKDSLLVSRDAKNIAILQVYGPSYEGGFPFSDIRTLQKLEFRFFAPSLCDAGGSIRFHINGELGRVRAIEPFSK